MGVVHLVRHGQASWGAEDYDVLSDLGERQAAVVGEALAAAGVVPDLVVHGAMTRQRRTAELAIAAAGWSASVRADEGWDEMDHQMMFSAGPQQGTFDERFAGAVDRWQSGRHDHEYAESFPEFGERVDAALDALPIEGTTVVFTSGGPICVTARRLLETGLAAYRLMTQVVVNASITTVTVGASGPRLIAFNAHTHLPGELRTYR